MAVAKMPTLVFRLERADSSRLMWAFALSLAFHLLLCGGYYAAKKFGWWEHLRALRLLPSATMLTHILPKKERPLPPPPQEPPLMFVDVNPMQATPEPPKDAKYYSSHNSKAANPEPAADLDTPKIAGIQEHVPKTEDVPKFVPLQPALPVAPAKEEQPEQKARPAEPPGDLALAKPEPAKPKDPGQEPQSRPRTIKEALARKNLTQIPGEKMKQEGGVRRRLEIASLDAKATPFGAYDAMLVEAISQRWYSLLAQRDYASDSRGKVVLHFRLHQDGRITAMEVADNSAGEVLGLICQKSVLDPAPFPVWPAEMRRVMGETRNIQFTFYYN